MWTGLRSGFTMAMLMSMPAPVFCSEAAISQHCSSLFVQFGDAKQRLEDLLASKADVAALRHEFQQFKVSFQQKAQCYVDHPSVGTSILIPGTIGRSSERPTPAEMYAKIDRTHKGPEIPNKSISNSHASLVVKMLDHEMSKERPDIDAILQLLRLIPII